MRLNFSTRRFSTAGALVCVNKADICPAETDEIESYCWQQGVEAVGRIPFDLTVANALVAGKAVTAFQPEAPASIAIARIWERVVSLLEKS